MAWVPLGLGRNALFFSVPQLVHNTPGVQFCCVTCTSCENAANRASNSSWELSALSFWHINRKGI